MAHTLVTIPFSHFCEKARWSLDAAGVSYREEGHVPVLHRRAVRRARGRRSVPVLLLENGSTLDESPGIVQFADAQAPAHRRLLPREGPARDEALALERAFDADFAPHVRHFVYFHRLPSRSLTLRLFEIQTPRLERIIASTIFPLLRVAIRRFMKIDAPNARRARDRIRTVFDGVGSRIADRPYLLEDRFSALDITFAAFAAPMLLPSEHPVMAKEHEPLRLLPQAFVDEVGALRETPAGRFALRIYRDHRGTPSV